MIRCNHVDVAMALNMFSVEIAAQFLSLGLQASLQRFVQSCVVVSV